MRYLLLAAIPVLLSGCGVKDPSFYDLKSPCVSISTDETDPCSRRAPEFNEVYEEISL